MRCISARPFPLFQKYSQTVCYAVLHLKKTVTLIHYIFPHDLFLEFPKHAERPGACLYSVLPPVPNL